MISLENFTLEMFSKVLFQIESASGGSESTLPPAASPCPQSKITAFFSAPWFGQHRLRLQFQSGALGLMASSMSHPVATGSVPQRWSHDPAQTKQCQRDLISIDLYG